MHNSLQCKQNKKNIAVIKIEEGMLNFHENNVTIWVLMVLKQASLYLYCLYLFLYLYDFSFFWFLGEI